MPRYQFALSNSVAVREAGVVHSDSFTDALSAIGKQVSARQGDTLEVSVRGFPPARYQCVWSGGPGASAWQPAGLRAA
jgi:hypothetical protein